MVMESNRTFVIAEAGVNHNGSLDLALQMVDTAARCGADAVKFQTFKADKLVRRGASKAAYQLANTGVGDQHSMLSSLELSESMHHVLFDRCTTLGIEFMSTPFDEDSAEFLLDLGMRRIKISSGEITNYPLLRFLSRKNIPLILSTGMSTLDEVQHACSVISAERISVGLDEPLSKILSILHCTSNYPAQLQDVNLRAMITIAEATDVPVGYSDHTLGVSVSTAAVACGASIIEKHFTLDKSLPGPDHPASLSPDELTLLIQNIRSVESALGSPLKCPTKSELPVRDLVRRSVTSSRDLAAGKPIVLDDICLLRPGTGIPPCDLNNVLGRTLKTSISAGTTLNWGDFT